MTYLIGERILKHEVDRLHSPISTLLVIAASVAKCFAWELGVRRVFQPGEFIGPVCNLFSLVVKLPLVGPIELAAAGKIPSEIQILFESTGVPPHGPGDDNYFAFFMNKTISPIFITFYETYVEWLEENVSTDRYKWPTAWRFSRLIRNAIVHGDSLRIDNPKALIVSWHVLSYGPTNNRKRVIGTDLAVGDMLVLMFEMSDELGREPINPPGGRLVRVRYSPIATNFRGAAK